MRINTPVLDREAKAALEKGYKTGASHTFRQRCQVILLKSEGRDSKQVGGIVKMCEMTVNNWVSRYKQEGIAGLKTKAGRGRKPLLTIATDSERVKAAVEANRQSLRRATEAFKAESNQTLSHDTLRRFLKSLVDDTNE